MINKSIVRAYESTLAECKIELSYERHECFLESDNTNLFWYPMPKQIVLETRDKFDICSKEEILFVCTCFSKEENLGGFVVTDCNIITTAGEYKDCHSWETIKSVRYNKAKKSLVFLTDGDKFTLEIYGFLKTDIVSKAFPLGGIQCKKYIKEIDFAGNIIAKIFMNMASAQELETEEKDRIERFLDIPFEKRKILLLTKQGYGSQQDSFFIFNKDHRPNIIFPVGHPITDQLYVGHPFIPNKYFPVECYEMEIMTERMREFVRLMQCLGATEVEINGFHSSYNKEDATSNREIEGDVSYKGINVETGFDKELLNRFMKAKGERIHLHQKYSPSLSEPQKDLIWFKYERSWQDTYKQRMESLGTFLSHEDQIRTSESCVINKRELKRILVRARTIIVGANFKWEKFDEKDFEVLNDIIFSVKVKFAPMEKPSGYNPIEQPKEDELDKKCLKQNEKTSTNAEVTVDKKFFCEYCGNEYPSVRELTSARCPRHPDGPSKGYHKLYQGGEKSRYTCKYCGNQYASIRIMTGSRCGKHPDGPGKGFHSPAL